MKRKAVLGIGFAAIVFAGSYYWWSTRRKAPPVPPGPPRASSAVAGQTARVRVAQGRFGTISEEITVYGDVIPAPGSIQTISVPFETRITRIMVNAGQRLSSGDMLLELRPGPDAVLQLEEAQGAFTAAEQNLAQVQGRFKLQLATSDQVLQAQQALELARVRRQSLLSRQQSAPDGRIRASEAGLVTKILVHEGQIVGAGAALLEVVGRDRLEVRLGIEAEDIDRLNTHQAVLLHRASTASPASLSGRIRRRSRVVNPATRLVDVFVDLPPGGNLLLGEPMVGRLTIASARGFIVPRSAVIPEEGSFVLFTVQHGKAVKHSVQIGLESETEVQVLGQTPLRLDPIVVLGNYVLQDGMHVILEQR